MASTEVRLPNGDLVTISDTSEKWWSTPGSAGYVDPKFLAPDPIQPRRFMNSTRLEELKESVIARGVRDHIVVTLLEWTPWARVDPEYQQCLF